MFIVTFQKYRRTESKNKSSSINPLPKRATVSILSHTFKTHTPEDRFCFQKWNHNTLFVNCYFSLKL